MDDDCCELAETIPVETDSSLLESECLLSANGDELARVEAALGSPGQPMDEHKLAAKVADLAGAELVELLHDPGRPAAQLLARVIRS